MPKHGRLPQGFRGIGRRRVGRGIEAQRASLRVALGVNRAVGIKKSSFLTPMSQFIIIFVPVFIRNFKVN